MTEAILTFADSNLPTTGLNLKSRKLVHWILHALAGCCITAAFVIIILNKNRLGKDHFTTNHGIVGLTAIVCGAVSIIGGVFTYYGFELRRYIKPIQLKIMHSLFGLCGYILTIATIILGLYSPWFLENVSYEIVGICIAVIVMVAVYVVLQPLIRVCSRVRSM